MEHPCWEVFRAIIARRIDGAPPKRRVPSGPRYSKELWPYDVKRSHFVTKSPFRDRIRVKNGKKRRLYREKGCTSGAFPLLSSTLKARNA